MTVPASFKGPIVRLVFGLDQQVAAFVADRIAHVKGVGFGVCTAIGVEHNGTLLGGVVYSDYRPRQRSIEMSAASVDTRWLIGPPGDRKGFLRAFFAYPFDQLKVERITMQIARKNRAARAFADGFGFKREGLARKGFGEDDAVIYGLLRKEWKAGPWATA